MTSPLTSTPASAFRRWSPRKGSRSLPASSPSRRSTARSTPLRSRRSCLTPTTLPTSAARSPTLSPLERSTTTFRRSLRCFASTFDASWRSPVLATTLPTHHPDDNHILGSTLRGDRARHVMRQRQRLTPLTKVRTALRARMGPPARFEDLRSRGPGALLVELLALLHERL